MSSNPSVNKRQKERNRQEHQAEKADKKKQRRVEKAARPPGEPGVDPDIAGIIPGPQPREDDEALLVDVGSAMSRPWTVLPHEPLRRLEPNLWEVEGSLPSMPIKRRMCIVRRTDGSLLVHSALAADDATMREIDAWGRVKTIVVPNAFHRLDAAAFRARYPEANVVCPKPVTRRVAEEVAVDGALDAIAAGDDLRVEPLDGVKMGEAVFVVTSPGDRVTLLFNDALFNHAHASGFKGFVFRMIGSTGGPRVTPLFRFAAVDDAAKLRAHLSRLADTPGLRRLIPAHGEIIEESPQATLKSVAGL